MIDSAGKNKGINKSVRKICKGKIAFASFKEKKSKMINRYGKAVWL
jgi:hypothetical protein